MLETRNALVDPIPAIFEAALALSAAVDAHLSGDYGKASELIRQADCPDVWAYIDAGWGKGAKARYGFVTDPCAPPCLPIADRPKPRMPTNDVKAIVKQRDRLHCRFCGIPLIDAAIRKAMVRAYPSEIGWPRTDIGKHAAFTCMWLQYDHILPNSRGGDSSPDNIVLTCAACNFGRMETTLEEGRLANPLHGEARVAWAGYDAWDGLERFIDSHRPTAKSIA